MKNRSNTIIGEQLLSDIEKINITKLFIAREKDVFLIEIQKLDAQMGEFEFNVVENAGHFVMLIM